MTNRQKKDKIIQLLKEENIVPGSIAFNVDNNPRVMRFAIKDFYTTFKQEDLVRFRYGKNEYDVLVLTIRHEVDTCFVRGLIKVDRVLAEG